MQLSSSKHEQLKHPLTFYTQHWHTLVLTRNKHTHKQIHTQLPAVECVHRSNNEQRWSTLTKLEKKNFALKSLSKANTTKGNNGYNTKIWYCKITVAHKAETKCEAYVIVSIYMYKTFMISIE